MAWGLGPTLARQTNCNNTWKEGMKERRKEGKVRKETSNPSQLESITILNLL